MTVETIPNTFEKFNGTGSQATEYTYSFTPYEADDVLVYVKESGSWVLKTVTSHYTHNSGTKKIQFVTGQVPASGTANILILRKTDITNPKTDFQPGSSIRAQDLDNNQTQVLNALQDLYGRNFDVLAPSLDGPLDMNSNKITDLATPTANTDAATKAYVDTQTTSTSVADGAITSAKLHGDLLVTNSEQGSHTANDTSVFSTQASDARYFNISTGETIKDGDTFPDNDTTIATTAAINDRIVDLVEEVGGFVPIANETSFPNANPDVNNDSGTLISIKALASALTSNGSGVATIANGNVANNATITINGLENSTTYAAGFGMIVETTSTLHTYTFHRQTPKATEVTTVAGKATEIGRLGTADAVADMALLGTTDCVADMALLGTSDVVADMALLGTSDCVSDMNTLGTTDNVSNMNTVADGISNVNTVAGSISNVNTVASNMSTVNDFSARYRVASSAPGSSNDEGDLYFNTTSNELQVYNGSSWQGGVTATGNLVSTGGSTMTGDLVMDNQADIRFEEATANGNNYIALQAPASIASNVTLTLPNADGSANQALLTDGSGTLSWGSTTDSSKMPTAGGAFTGDVTINAQEELRFADADSSNYVGFKAPATVGTNVIWTLPTADGSNGQYLKTNGSGVLDWAADTSLTLIDEDDFSSDSATQPPSQQSAKAYIAATSQPLDADLTSLSSCQSGSAAALALLNSTEVGILDGATVSTTELNLLQGKTALGDAVLSADNQWSGAQRSTVTTATHSSGATYDFDLTATNCHKLTISAAVELGFSNTANAIGQSGTIEIVNGAITPTWASEVYWAGGTSKAASLTQSATSVLAYYVFAQDKVLVEAMLDVKNTA
tara:strand:- start:99 stop:2651 length:2553 start_codon:yes stop_codon:yes gene_type:complete